MIEPTSVLLRRRSFLTWCGSAGLGSTLFPGALWAQSAGGTATITSDMIEAAVLNEREAKAEMGISLMKAFDKQGSFGGYSYDKHGVRGIV